MKTKLMVKRFSFFLLGCLILFALIPPLHEIGHCIPVFLTGGRIQKIGLFGYEIFPDFGRKSLLGLPGFISPKWPEGYPPSNIWLGLMMFSGAGFTLLIAFISSLVLLLTKPNSILKYFLTIFSFGFVDILNYSFVPLLKLRPADIAPIQRMEPIEGLMYIGLDEQTALVIVAILVCIMVLILLWNYKTFLKRIIKIKNYKILNEEED